MSHVEGNVNVGGSGVGQDNRTPETPPFAFQTPPTGRQPRAQPTRSERSTASAAIIVDLQQQLEARDAELQRRDRDMERM